MDSDSSENTQGNLHRDSTEPRTKPARSTATRILSGVYRLLALVVILLISFTVIYTIALFTPGLSVSGVGFTDCPSAFSNPKPIINKPLDRDLEKLDQRIRDDSDERDLNLTKYPANKDDTLLIRLINMKKFLLEELKNITEFRTDEPSLETYRKLDMNLCAYDRATTNKDFLEKQSEASYQYQMDSTDDSYSAFVMSYYSDGQDPFLRFLTTQNVLILWSISATSVVVLVLIRKKLTPYQRTHKWVRRTTAGVVIVALIIITVYPLVFELYNEDGESCRAYNAFDIRKSPSEKPGDALLAIRKNLTISSQDTITKAEKAQKTTFSNEEKAEFKKEHNKIRTQALKLFAQLDKTEIERNTIANQGKATADCVSCAREAVLTSGFGLLILAGYVVFLRGRKSSRQNTPTIE